MTEESTKPTRPPGPAFQRRGPAGPPIWSLTLRMAIGATILSAMVLAFQASRLSLPSAKDGTDETGSAAGEHGAPAAATGTAATGAGEAEHAPPARDPRQVPFHGLLDSVSDYDDVAQDQRYAKLGEWVRHLTDEEAARIINEDIDYRALTKNPGSWRGELTRVDGLLIKLEPVRLVPGAGPPGVEDAWRGWLMEPDGNEAFVFDLVGAPVEINRRDIVRVEGAFLKVLRYETQRGDTRDAPFLIARRAWALSEDEIVRPFRYDYVAVCLAAVVLVVVLVMRRQAAQDRAMLDSKRDELARKLNKPKGEA